MAVQRIHKHIREVEYKTLRKKTLSLPRFWPVKVSVTWPLVPFIGDFRAEGCWDGRNSVRDVFCVCGITQEQCLLTGCSSEQVF